MEAAQLASEPGMTPGLAALDDEKKADPHAPQRSAEYDRAAVDAAVLSMHAKLRMNAHKGPWDSLDPWQLFERAKHEMLVELKRAMLEESPTAIRSEAADAMNFLMMIHANADRIVAERNVP